MEESPTPEHGGELVADTLEKLLYGSAITNEGRRHSEATRHDVIVRRHNVVRYPFNEVGGVLVPDDANLILDLLHGNLTTVDGRASQVAAIAEVGGGQSYGKRCQFPMTGRSLEIAPSPLFQVMSSRITKMETSVELLRSEVYLVTATRQR